MNGAMTWLPMLAFLATAWQSGASAQPNSVDDERATFQLSSGLDIQLVAAEPDVVDPVAVSWDEWGRMYVCEMRDYPAEETGGRIKLLEDRDGDGHIDLSTVFADNLHYPTSALPCRGGVLVSAAPDILFLKDTDGDGRADVRQVLFTGFGEGNQQLRVNGLTWGLDGWVYGANGRSDGEVRCVSTIEEGAPLRGATTQPVSIRGRDFRFQPERGIIEATAGFSQFGHSFDDFGGRFLSWNTIHIRHVVLDPLSRSPFVHLAPSEATLEIADHGSTGRIYPASRTTKRFNAEEPGFFNASCGLTIYRGDLLPLEFQGQAYVCEPLSNVVHRDQLTAEGASFVASRAAAEQQSEFLSSTDSWFRPVNLATGPDGALYVIDFYRQLVEHPQFVADKSAREATNFRVGNDFGRIWRITPQGSRPAAWPQAGRRSSTELVGQLNNRNGWIRDTAQRVLSERRAGSPGGAAADRESVITQLDRLILQAGDERVRAQALWTRPWTQPLDQDSALLHALNDPAPRVREQAAMLLMDQTAFATPAVEADVEHNLLSLSQSDDARLRLLALWRLCQKNADAPQSALEDSRQALVGLWSRDGTSPWFQRLVLSRGGAAAADGSTLLSELLRVVGISTAAQGEPLGAEQLDFLEAVASRRARIDPAGCAAELAALQGAAQRVTAMAVLCGFVQARRTGAAGLDPFDPTAKMEDSATRQQTAVIVDAAQSMATDASAPDASRVMAVRVIGLMSADEALPQLTALIDSEQSIDIERAAIRALEAFSDPAVADVLLEKWPQATPAIRRSMLDLLLSRREFSTRIVEAVERGVLAVADFDSLNTDRLLRLCDDATRARAEPLLSQRIDTNRARVIDELQGVLDLTGDPASGGRLFIQNCQVCHAVQGHGQRIGPDLASVARRPPGDVLVDVLDPSRNVALDGMSYIVILKDGRVLSGLLKGEDAQGVTLRRVDGEDSLPRTEIEELRNTGRSLMPEGFEKNLTPQALADLLSFLKTGQPALP